MVGVEGDDLTQKLFFAMWGLCWCNLFASFRECNPYNTRMCLSRKQLKQSSTKHNIGRFSISMTGEQEIQLESVPGHSSTGRFPPPKSKKSVCNEIHPNRSGYAIQSFSNQNQGCSNFRSGFTKFFISKNLFFLVTIFRHVGPVTATLTLQICCQQCVVMIYRWFREVVMLWRH